MEILRITTDFKEHYNYGIEEFYLSKGTEKSTLMTVSVQKRKI